MINGNLSLKIYPPGGALRITRHRALTTVIMEICIFPIHCLIWRKHPVGMPCWFQESNILQIFKFKEKLDCLLAHSTDYLTMRLTKRIYYDDNDFALSSWAELFYKTVLLFIKITGIRYWYFNFCYLRENKYWIRSSSCLKQLQTFLILQVKQNQNKY